MTSIIPNPKVALSCLLFGLIGSAAADAAPLAQSSGRSPGVLAQAVRHELLTLPYYDVFDWIEAEVFEDGRVELRGTVVDPDTSQGAEARAARVDGVTAVTNEIEVLYPSPADDRLRRAIYRELYSLDSPLAQYAMRATPSIHIIVDQGRVTLKGAVISTVDRRYAEAAARGVSGVIDVTNELMTSTDSE